VTYAAEPYAQFVDDLLTALTGGEIRQRFVFLDEGESFELAAPGPILPATVRVTGQLDGAFHRFRREVDYLLEEGTAIRWQPAGAGDPGAAAVRPDVGTAFYVNFETRAPAGVVPPLTDRNPGSITRLLAESFGREYAVLSRQLEAVYRAGFVDTAGGRDLDQVVRLVGITRHRATVATGSVVFSRSSPAPGEVTVPAGTRLSTSEPPATTFETSEKRTLRRGDLSVEVPVAATAAGGAGVVPAGAITVIHRPILGLESVTNPQATRLGGADETDEALRARARRALEGSGGATRGALLAALTSLPGMSEKDIRIDQDHLAHPGVVRLNAVLPAAAGGNGGAEDQEALRRRAVELIEQTRPVGVRVLHNLDTAAPAGEATPGPGEDDPEEAPVGLGEAADDDQLMPVGVEAEIAPTTLTLTSEERKDLQSRAEQVVRDFVDRAGIGEVLVYNRLVADLMALPGVLDVSLRMFPESDPTQPPRRNLFPTDATLKPVLGSLEVAVGGRLVVIHVTVSIRLKGAGLLGDPAANLQAVKIQVESRLRETVPLLDEDLTPASLLRQLAGAETWEALAAHYDVSYMEAGVRVRERDVTVAPTTLERLWIGKVTVTEDGGA
jgi:uncharacterized phage protein gp47/JayE